VSTGHVPQPLLMVIPRIPPRCDTQSVWIAHAASGMRATLTKQVAAARLRAKRQSSASLADESRQICPTCFLTLPVSGQCDNYT
jgi:hypothetical protein